MSSSNRLVAFLTLAASFGMAGQAGAVPGGSYLASCHHVHMEGPRLTALCGTGRGFDRWTSIYAPRCGGTGITNQRGRLECGGFYR